MLRRRLILSAALLWGCGPAATSPSSPQPRATLTPGNLPEGNVLLTSAAAAGPTTNTDADREQTVLDLAARDLACPRGEVSIAMTLDRRYANGYSLRYVVDGCGTRALYAEDCRQMSACRYLIASRMALGATAGPRP